MAARHAHNDEVIGEYDTGQEFDPFHNRILRMLLDTVSYFKLRENGRAHIIVLEKLPDPHK